MWEEHLTGGFERGAGGQVGRRRLIYFGHGEVAEKVVSLAGHLPRLLEELGLRLDAHTSGIWS